MLADWVDQKYIGLLSGRVEKFKRVDKNVWNMRCPICGDSKKNLNKARGYIFLKQNRYIYKCHNCGYGASFINFLKQIDINLYNEYASEKFISKSGRIDNKDKWQTRIEKTNIRRHEKFEPLKNIKKISQLLNEHPAKQYVIDRKIPFNKHWMLYYAHKFNKWINTILPGKLNERFDEPRLVIPFIDENGYVFAVAGRSFQKNAELRYITIKFDETKPKIFGLNTINWLEPIKLVEGPIDSLFLKNALAFSGTDGDLDIIESKADATIILDNQPRNQDVVKKLEKFIDLGLKIVIWPAKIVGKDINDMIRNGEISPDEIDQFIDNNTYYDLVARLKLSEWSKI